ncbi:MAG: DUF615 domain-containing protein [Gammaproteobacteria bacterium]|nr:DUF615 domain-containing protein [Gammaproteobacteria bacterium]MDD9895886.1 DUF615 domain-containing protein [Gammaproteobacteria bacterium]MDD9960296.1 DUF615 domain-containing protein [Gammaproteobacteria bacterium]
MLEKENTEELVPSKTQRKQIARELQDLGQKLTTFKAADLDRLPLAEKLRSAISDFHRFPNSYGARKRQMQYIGKLMRDCDKNEIEQAILKLNSNPKKEEIQDALQVQIRELLLQKGDEGISKILADFPAFERQKLRQLYREYCKTDPTKHPALKEKVDSYIATILQ